jgi:hypothetical protein
MTTSLLIQDLGVGVIAFLLGAGVEGGIFQLEFQR